MRVNRPRSVVVNAPLVARLALVLWVAGLAPAANAIEGEDPPEPLAPAAPATPSADDDDTATPGDAPTTTPPGEAPPSDAPTTTPPGEAPPSDAPTTTPGDAAAGDAPSGVTPSTTTEATTDVAPPATSEPATSDAPKRRLLDAPKAPPDPPSVPAASEPTATTTTSETEGESPWLSATGYVALGVVAGMVPVALGVATLALGVLGFAWTAATPVGAANAAIPFALAGCGLLGGVGLAGPIGSAVVAAVTAGSAWTAYDSETAMDVLFGGAPGFFLAGLSLAGLPCACLSGGLAMVYLGAVFAEPTALLTAIGLAMLSSGLGGAAMGSACMAPCVTGVGAFAARNAIDHEKDRQREELRRERRRGGHAMAY